MHRALLSYPFNLPKKGKLALMWIEIFRWNKSIPSKVLSINVNSYIYTVYACNFSNLEDISCVLISLTANSSNNTSYFSRLCLHIYQFFPIFIWNFFPNTHNAFFSLLFILSYIFFLLYKLCNLVINLILNIIIIIRKKGSKLPKQFIDFF